MNQPEPRPFTLSVPRTLTLPSQNADSPRMRSNSARIAAAISMPRPLDRVTTCSFAAPCVGPSVS